MYLPELLGCVFSCIVINMIHTEKSIILNESEIIQEKFFLCEIQTLCVEIKISLCLQNVQIHMKK